MHVAEYKYLLLYAENHKLTERLAVSVSCDGGIEQSLINTSKNVSGYMDPLHTKAVKSQYTVRDSFLGSFASLVQRLQTLLAQKVAAVSKSVDDSRSEALIELRRSILNVRRLQNAGLTGW